MDGWMMGIDRQMTDNGWFPVNVQVALATLDLLLKTGHMTYLLMLQKTERSGAINKRMLVY